MAAPTPTDPWFAYEERVEITDEDGGRSFQCEDPQRFVDLHTQLQKMYEELRKQHEEATKKLALIGYVLNK